jgi:hypothetical protein
METGTMIRTLSLLGGAAVLAIAASASVPAMANGGDFFNELSESWGANADTGVPYFGWVRDARGKPIARAIVTATVTDGPDGQSVTIISDNLGHYKIPGLGKDIDPKKVVIDCAKVGYRAVQQDRRVLRSLPKAPVEVDCKLAPVATATS